MIVYSREIRSGLDVKCHCADKLEIGQEIAGRSGAAVESRCSLGEDFRRDIGGSGGVPPSADKPEVGKRQQGEGHQTFMSFKEIRICDLRFMSQEFPLTVRLLQDSQQKRELNMLTFNR